MSETRQESEAQKAMKRYAAACLGLILIFLALFLFFVDELEGFSDCPSVNLVALRDSMISYSKQHGGRFPGKEEILKLVENPSPSPLPQRERERERVKLNKSHFYCPKTKAPYTFGKLSVTFRGREEKAVIWDSKPHGIFRKWRYVVFSNGSIEKVPEKKFLKIQ